MARILITGSSGTLGSYIKQALCKSKRFEGAKLAGLGRTKKHAPTIRHYQCSVLEKEKMIDVLDDFAPDHIFHLAWETTHGSYWHDPHNCQWSEASIYLAEEFAKRGGKFFSFAGTCAEQPWLGTPLEETCEHDYPATLYGKEKLKVTRHLDQMNQKGRLSANSCRLFFPFSQTENPNRVTSLVVKAAMLGETFHLRTGDVIRDICHTKHIASTMVELAHQKKCGVINMSPDKSLHMGDFLDKVAKQVNENASVTWDEWGEHQGEPQNLTGINTKAKPHLDISGELDHDISEFAQGSRNRFTDNSNAKDKS